MDLVKQRDNVGLSFSYDDTWGNVTHIRKRISIQNKNEFDILLEEFRLFLLSIGYCLGDDESIGIVKNDE